MVFIFFYYIIKIKNFIKSSGIHDLATQVNIYILILILKKIYIMICFKVK
jgi:hypothetical protein